MNCSNCGLIIADESLGYCVECGETFGVSPDGGQDADEGWQPQPSVWERVEQVLAPVRAGAGQVGDVFVNLLENPALYGQLPGGSLTFLGLGLVGLALLLSCAPFVSGIGWLGSGVMLGWGVLVGLREWREVSEAPTRDEGRFVDAYPAALDSLPGSLWRPGLVLAFTLVTCAYALLMVGYGPVSLLWMLAAGVLGYEQGRRFFFLLPRDEELRAEAEATLPGLHRWTVLGVVLCSFSLLLPWVRAFGHVPSLSGGELPLAVLTQTVLLGLGCYAVKHRGLGGLHPMFLILMALWLSMWLVLMNNVYSPGPWVYLFGVLAIDAAIARHLIPARPKPEEAPPASDEEPPPDLDYQG
jgi:hypothetical protein